jgi:hypothetical protein
MIARLVPSIVHLYDTAVIDLERGFGLSIATLNTDSLAGGELRDVDGLAARLGWEITWRQDASEQALLAGLAGLTLDRDATAAFEHAGSLLDQSPSRMLAALDPAVRAFVEHCAFEPIVGIEESPLSGKALASVVGTAGVIAGAIITAGAAPVLIAVAIGVGGAAVAVVVGAAAIGVAERVYEAIAPNTG